MNKNQKNYPAITVDALVIEKGKIVLVKRKYDPFKDFWALPGGFIELEETVEAACIREVKEETNLDIKFLSFQGSYSHPSRDSRRHIITIACFCKIQNPDQTLRGGDDAKKAQFFNVNEVFEIRNKLAFDHFNIIKNSGFLNE